MKETSTFVKNCLEAKKRFSLKLLLKGMQLAVVNNKKNCLVYRKGVCSQWSMGLLHFIDI